jgi:hypothetical protein
MVQQTKAALEALQGRGRLAGILWVQVRGPGMGGKGGGEVAFSVMVDQMGMLPVVVVCCGATWGSRWWQCWKQWKAGAGWLAFCGCR